MFDGPSTPEFYTQVAFSMAIGAAMAVGIVVGVMELVWIGRRKQLSRAARREMLLSIGHIAPNTLVSVLMAPIWLAIYLAAHSFSVLELPLTPWVFLLALLAADFSYYWEHRCAHKVKWLWRLYHAMHHSSPRYTVATAYRVSFLNQFFAPAFYIPWILLGFEPLLIAGFQLFVFHYQAWLHTEMIGPLGRWDRWFNTPANHRMHHSRNPRHQDVNFGALLMVWDRMFGSYALPEPALEYGIPDQTAPGGWIELYTKPWRS